MLVDPTRSQNITVIGRRSAETAGPLGGLGSDWEAGTSAVGFAPASAAIASSNCSRSPRAETPMSLRSSFVNRGSRSALILLSRKFVSYWPSPRPRSHPPTSMVGLQVCTGYSRSPTAVSSLRLIREAGIDSSDGQER